MISFISREGFIINWHLRLYVAGINLNTPFVPSKTGQDALDVEN